MLGVAKTLAEAVEASRGGLRLLSSRRFDDDDDGGWIEDVENDLSKWSRALAKDAGLLAVHGPLELVNEGARTELSLRLSSLDAESLDAEALEVAPDGLVVSTSSSVVLFNSVKHAPSDHDIAQLLSDAARQEFILSGFSAVTTTPPAVKEQLATLLPAVFGPSQPAAPLRGRLRVVPFLSGDNVRAAVAASCERAGVGVVRPSGEGFVVQAVRAA